MCEINTNLTSTRPSQCNNRLLQSIVVLIITTCKLTVEKDKKKKGKRKKKTKQLKIVLKNDFVSGDGVVFPRF